MEHVLMSKVTRWAEPSRPLLPLPLETPPPPPEEAVSGEKVSLPPVALALLLLLLLPPPPTEAESERVSLTLLTDDVEELLVKSSGLVGPLPTPTPPPMQ